MTKRFYFNWKEELVIAFVVTLVLGVVWVSTLHLMDSPVDRITPVAVYLYAGLFRVLYRCTSVIDPIYTWFGDAGVPSSIVSVLLVAVVPMVFHSLIVILMFMGIHTYLNIPLLSDTVRYVIGYWV